MARILVVDDSPTETHQFVNVLAKHGHQVLTAASGTDGIDLANEELPDVILMDVVMPGINGFQATRQLTRDNADAPHPGDHRFIERSGHRSRLGRAPGRVRAI